MFAPDLAILPVIFSFGYKVKSDSKILSISNSVSSPLLFMDLKDRLIFSAYDCPAFKTVKNKIPLFRLVQMKALDLNFLYIELLSGD